tara:strand:- start:58 stop:1221 length:1164 start_codon:yes stop_codon:yes gene_type:complete
METDGATTDYTVNGVEAVNFVVRAFNDLNEHYKESVSSGVMDYIKGYDDIRLKKGIVSPSEAYYSHLRSVKTFFIDTFLKRHSEKILDFRSMVECFYLFVEKHGKTFPVTKTGFTLSGRCPPNVTGLKLDFELFDPADDELKKSFLEDECHFIYFSNLCARYGFFVAKNSPWKLVANLASERMNRYVNRFRSERGIEKSPLDGSAGQVFEEFYVKTMFDDFYDLIRFLETCYVEFVESDPFFLKPVFKNGRTDQCKTTRAELRREHPSYFFLVLLKTRLAETALTYKVGEPELLATWREALDVAQMQNLDAGIKFISDFVKSRNLNLQILLNNKLELDKISKIGNIYRYEPPAAPNQKVGIVSDGHTSRKMPRVANPRDNQSRNPEY